MFKQKNFLYIFLWFTLTITIFNTSIFTSKLHAKAVADEPSWQSQVEELNEKITILRRWQEGYRMTAEQAQFKADRLQFEESQLIDAKRLWKVAENANQKAQDLQVIIDKLETQRNAILKKHNQPIPRNSK